MSHEDQDRYEVIGSRDSDIDCDDNGNPALKYTPFPTDALPSIASDLVYQAGDAMGCDHAFVALPLLGAAAAAVGNTRRVSLKVSWSEPAILWLATVAPSGSLKSPPQRLVTKPLRHLQADALRRHAEEMEAFQSDVLRFQKDVAAFKRGKNDGDPPQAPTEPSTTRYLIRDTTLEALVPILQANPRGVLLDRDELNGWIGSFGAYNGRSGESASWLELYAGEAITVDRKTGFPRTLHVDHAGVSIIGTIQPQILKLAATVEHRASGLLARLFIAMPPRRRKVWTERDIDSDLERRFLDVFIGLTQMDMDSGLFGARPVLVGLEESARQLWVDYYNRQGKEHAELFGDLAASHAKLEAGAARLALVTHMFRVASGDRSADPLLIDAQSMVAGIALRDWFFCEAQRVYALLDEDEDEARRREVVDLIRARGGRISANELRRARRDMSPPGVAQAFLDGLVRNGIGRWADHRSGPAGGRPTMVFALLDEQPPPASARRSMTECDAASDSGGSASPDVTTPGDSPRSETRGLGFVDSPPALDDTDRGLGFVDSPAQFNDTDPGLGFVDSHPALDDTEEHPDSRGFVDGPTPPHGPNDQPDLDATSAEQLKSTVSYRPRAPSDDSGSDKCGAETPTSVTGNLCGSVYETPNLQGAVLDTDPVYETRNLHGAVSDSDPVYETPNLRGAVSGSDPVYETRNLRGAVSGSNPVYETRNLRPTEASVAEEPDESDDLPLADDEVEL